ncbi:MAG TPA: hypothetical protein RMH99_09970 [Sandaracinaceae bacterium LLY-WYZ-13_1]|nr:hypothetical protein [Sandaracinaceae bacterium LLY-WYZ-13_1]
MRTAVLALVLLVGCDGGPRCGDELACESVRVPVDHPDGFRDEVWVYTVVPSEGADLPIVVYAPGQGQGGIANCEPDARSFGTPNARALASRGFAVAAVRYRNVGDGAPGIGVLRMRDHHARDARALLGAARALRDRLGARGSDRVAFVGSSMGTWPALWAVSAHPDVADLQDGLDLRTTIVHGETGNHLSNGADRCGEETSEQPDVRVRFAAGAAQAALRTEATALGLPEVTAADLEAGRPLGDAIRHSLTERGVELLRAVFFEAADPSLEGCGGAEGLPAECAGLDCLTSLYVSRFGNAPVSELLRSDVIEARCAFSAETPDPGPETGNRFVTGLREQSPAYAMPGPPRVSRALSLLSEGDPHHDPAAQALLLERLESLGISVPRPPPNPGPSCGHGDYEDSSRPECGLDLIAAELDAAFAP